MACDFIYLHIHQNKYNGLQHTFEIDSSLWPNTRLIHHHSQVFLRKLKAQGLHGVSEVLRADVAITVLVKGTELLPQASSVIGGSCGLDLEMNFRMHFLVSLHHGREGGKVNVSTACNKTQQSLAYHKCISETAN